MKKYTLTAFLLVAVIALSNPFAAFARGDDNQSDHLMMSGGGSTHASTTIDVGGGHTQALEARLKALTDQIEALKKRLEEIKGGKGSTTNWWSNHASTTKPHEDVDNGPRNPKVCNNLTVLGNLLRGHHGEGVRVMQYFLQQEGFLSNDSATGNFGTKTEDALKAWQMSHGVIATGTPSSGGAGMFGKRTREAMNRRCNMRGDDNGQNDHQSQGGGATRKHNGNGGGHMGQGGNDSDSDNNHHASSTASNHSSL